MKVIETNGSCKDCAFYNDCPAEYECPPLEILNDMLYNKCVLVSDGNGNLFGAQRKNVNDMDNDNTKE